MRLNIIKRIISNKFLAKANNSISTVISNACFILKDMIFQFLPEDTLKDYHIGTSMTAIRAARQEIFKKRRPFVIIKPKISLEDDPLYGEIYRYHKAYYEVKSDMYAHEPLFSDMKNDIYIYFINDRINLAFDIEFVCDSDIEQKNLAYTLKSVIPHKVPFYLYEQSLEIEVPKSLIKYLALANGFIQDNKPFEYDKFPLYLDSHSVMQTTKKIKTATGRPEYFFNYKTNIICNYEDFPSIDEGESINMITANF